MNCGEFDARLRAWTWPDPGLGTWLDEQRDLEPCIAEGLRKSRELADWNGFERYLIAAEHHPSSAYTQTLCEVLDERRDDLNSEEIVEALDRSADPASVPCLRRAVSWVPDWDEFGELARKAVWALDRIGTPEAAAAIREAVTPDLPSNVVEAAEKALATR